MADYAYFYAESATVAVMSEAVQPPAPSLQDRVSAVVVALLALNDMSQKDLARRMNVTPGTISAKLSGARRWTLDELSELALIFGTEPEAFLGSRKRAILGIVNSDGEVDYRRNTHEYLRTSVQDLDSWRVARQAQRGQDTELPLAA